MSSQQIVGHYRITAKLGEGGMGEVYRATDTKLGREVAIKVIPDSFANDPGRMARFAREAQVLASLNHPNIAAIYGVEDRALVMELVPGPTLAERIAVGAMPLEEALPLVRQLIDALEYAHERGVVHRDLKPANIKVTPDGRLKVLDFGLAKALGSESAPGDPSASPTLTMRDTMAGALVGTAAYMAPEQARGHAVDKRADIWAFGVVLCEMLTGRRLFGGPTISDTLAAVLTREPEWTLVPTGAHRLLRACLERDSKRRLRDIGDARRLLEDAEAPSPAVSAPPSRPLPWIVSTTALALIAAYASWTAWRATRPIERPLQRFSVDLGPEAIIGNRVTAILSPDGARLVFAIRNADGSVQLATRTLDQPKPTPLAGTEGAADPFFSPDGQWVGFFASGKMKKISVHGGATVNLCNATAPRGAAWNEDGTIIVSPNLTSGLQRIPDSGGPFHPLTDPTRSGEKSHRWPQILPGGQAVLYTGSVFAGNYEEASVEVLSLKTGQTKSVTRGGYFARYLPSGHLVYVHQGTLFAVLFDLDRLEIRGTATPVQDEVSANAISGAGQFDFSRTGTFIYVSGKGQNRSAISWMDSAGNTKPLLPSPGSYLTPRFSPDGRRLALAINTVAGGELWAYDLDRASMTQLTFNARVARSPAWTPDGRHIVLTAIGPKGGYDIWWVRADGAGEPQVLLAGKGATLYPYSFSPDGKRLAFFDTSGQGGADISILPLDTTDPEHPKPGQPEPFLHTEAAESEPAFSPDGRWIAYASDESGSGEVYVRPYKGAAASSSGHWRISPSGGRSPMWSRDGRQIFFVAADDRIWVADCAREGDTFQSSNPRRWSDRPFLDPVQGPMRMLDIAPDGKHFAITESTSAARQQGSPHLTVLFNFFDELRRRMPPK